MTDLHTTETIRALLVDVDGTLVGEDFEVTPRVRAALEQAHEHGVYVSLCTGRPDVATQHYIDDLQLSGFHIFDSGATISDPLNGITLYQQGITRSIAHEVLNFARAQNLYTEVYGGGNYFANFEGEHSRMHAELQRWQPIIGDLAEVIDSVEVTKMEVVVLNGDEKARAVALCEHFAGQLNFGWALAPGITAQFVNVLNKEVSKGEAVHRLLRHLGIADEQAMGVGDGPNDEPLFRSVGVSVAMGNATELLKQIATWVTAPVEQDGLAVAIDRYILSHFS